MGRSPTTEGLQGRVRGLAILRVNDFHMVFLMDSSFKTPPMPVAAALRPRGKQRRALVSWGGGVPGARVWQLGHLYHMSLGCLVPSTA